MKKELIFYLFFWLQWSPISISSLLNSHTRYHYLLSWYISIAVLQLLSFTISLYLSCVVVGTKKNENANNTSNEQEGQAPLNSSPAISLEVRRLNKIYEELNKTQSVETKELIDKYILLINKILHSLKINIKIK